MPKKIHKAPALNEEYVYCIDYTLFEVKITACVGLLSVHSNEMHLIRPDEIKWKTLLAPDEARANAKEMGEKWPRGIAQPSFVD